jgi:hypothetical protein
MRKVLGGNLIKEEIATAESGVLMRVSHFH